MITSHLFKILQEQVLNTLYSFRFKYLYNQSYVYCRLLTVSKRDTKTAIMATDATLEKQLGGLSRSGKVPKQAKVKNKGPAELQITAEQLLREAKERELEIVPAPPKQKVVQVYFINQFLYFFFTHRSKMRMSWRTIRCGRGKRSRIKFGRTGP